RLAPGALAVPPLKRVAREPRGRPQRQPRPAQLPVGEGHLLQLARRGPPGHHLGGRQDFFAASCTSLSRRLATCRYTPATSASVSSAPSSASTPCHHRQHAFPGATPSSPAVTACPHAGSNPPFAPPSPGVYPMATATSP